MTTPTKEFGQLRLKFTDPVQHHYEVIRPIVLFSETISERSRQTGIERTQVGQKAQRFVQQGMFGLEDHQTRPPNHPHNQMSLPFIKEVLDIPVYCSALHRGLNALYDYRFLPLGRDGSLHWAESGLTTLIVIARRTTDLATQKRSAEVSFYCANVSVDPADEVSQQELFQAIRGHWGVEADNYIRDVSFQEDKVKTKHANQAQVLASLRTLAIQLFRQAGFVNFKAALETFADSPDQFEAFPRNKMTDPELMVNHCRSLRRGLREKLKQCRGQSDCVELVVNPTIFWLIIFLALPETFLIHYGFL